MLKTLTFPFKLYEKTVVTLPTVPVLDYIYWCVLRGSWARLWMYVRQKESGTAALADLIKTHTFKNN